MNPRSYMQYAGRALVGLGLTLPVLSWAASTDLATTPLASSTTSAVKPNILFVLDDSGSMSSDYMPDEIVGTDYCKRSRSSSSDTSGTTACARGEAPFYASAINTIYYNPQITYSPGLNSDGTSRASFGSPWTAVYKNAYRTSDGTTNLVSGFQEIVYCNSDSASVNDSTQCKRNGLHGTDPTYGAYAYPNNGKGTAVSATTPVNNYGGFGTSSTSNPLRPGLTGSGGVVGSHTIRKARSGNAFYYTVTPLEYCNSSNLTFCIAATVPTGLYTFPAYLRFCTTATNAWAVPGATAANNAAAPTCQKKRFGAHIRARHGWFTRTDIVASTATYGGRPDRTDCVARPTCTYAEEMTNFANWYSYYSTRMQMMKTAAGRAFVTLGDRYRVGFITINPGTPVSSGEYLAMADFTTTNKYNWFAKLYSQTPGNMTPLREALARAGRYFAGVSIAGISDDPMQYSCQQNFTILTTDGYWNSNNGVELNGTTAIGNYDNVLGTATGQVTRPLYDGGSAGEGATLADVAQYYYRSDLRTSGPLEENNVPASGDDEASHQHMTTFTLGLGVDGQLSYQSDYKTATVGDYFDIVQGTKNWPKPSSSEAAKSDDLWHAAVNGRGTYFSARDPDSLVDGLTTALAGVNARVGAAAAAATSNLEPVAGDNYAYVANYQTVMWDGDIEARTIDLETGAVSEAPIWSARDQLDRKVSASADTRVIYTYTSDTAAFGTDKLKEFQWANLTTAEQVYFSAPTGAYVASLTQYASMSAGQRTAAIGDNLVRFLRGQTGNEGFDAGGGVDELYREREHTLGDIINAQPVYARAPYFDFNDAGYQGTATSFKETNASRDAMVYVAGNDGMLHAFNANTGDEVWAFVPSMVLPRLFKLADSDYANLHEYYVDGSPTVSDAYIDGAWRTVLVGGLNGGGKGYYALDVTTPSAPRGLWEFKHSSNCYPAVTNSDCHLGYSFGNPLITKTADGTWVVLVTSGYNNVNSPTQTGDGRGYLYVLNAATGEILDKISTGHGSSTTPSGLGKITNWVTDTTVDNTTERVYGGDLEGNLWRFDINSSLGAEGTEAFKLVQVVDASGTSQPITTRPELAEVSGQAVVYVATGRLLGVSDLADTQTQSIYGIKDALGTTTLTSIRSNLVRQTLTNTTDAVTGASIRTATANAVNFASDNGFYVDLPDTGERVNIDPKLQLGTLVVGSNVPISNACNVGGYSWINYLDYATGGSVSSTAKAGQRLSNSLVVGINIVRLPNGKTVAISTVSDNRQLTVEPPVSTSDPVGRRVTWREIVR